MAKGADVQKHKSADDISRMLLEGYTPDEVSKWLKQKYHHKMYWISGVTLTAYRNNFLNLTREQAWEKRKELLETKLLLMTYWEKFYSTVLGQT